MLNNLISAIRDIIHFLRLYDIELLCSQRRAKFDKQKTDTLMHPVLQSSGVKCIFGSFNFFIKCVS